jgi:hypothetical protein
MAEAEPIAWTAIPPNAPVRTSDGQQAGTVVGVLGRRDDDIFHGLTVDIGGHQVELPAESITGIWNTGIDTDLTQAELSVLGTEATPGSYRVEQRGFLGTRFHKKEEFVEDDQNR